MKKLSIIVTIMSLVFLISCGKEPSKKVPTPTTPVTPENGSIETDNPNQPTNNNNTQLVPKVIAISFTDTKYAIRFIPKA